MTRPKPSSHSIVSYIFQVLFHSPSWGSFHRSLTVLCTIGVEKYLALPSGLGGFTQDFTCLMLLGSARQRQHIFTYGTITPSGNASQRFLLTCCFVTLHRPARADMYIPQPSLSQRLAPWHERILGCFPFDRLYWGNLLRFLFFVVLRYFTSHTCRHLHPAVQDRFPHSDIPGWSRLLAPDRGFSQPITSFFGFSTQGIHI